MPVPRRHRGDFLRIQASLNRAALASLDQSSMTLRRLQNVFGEPSDSGIGSRLSELWSSWDAFANGPGDADAGSALFRQASSVASSINAASTSIRELQAAETEELAALVDQINTAATRLARLNRSIAAAGPGGPNLRHLACQRERLADRLAWLAGASIRRERFDQLAVSIDDTDLVNGNRTHLLTLVPDGPARMPVRAVASGGLTVHPTSGRLGAMLHDVNSVLPRYGADLDAVATTLRDQVNRLGFGGRPFFTGTNAITFAVAPDVARGPTATELGGLADFAESRVARAVADTATCPAGADAVYCTMIVRLAGHANDVRIRDSVQRNVVWSFDAVRNSHPGAEPDEEMTNIVEFQTAHEASSRFASTVDSVLDTLVDMVGP